MILQRQSYKTHAGEMILQRQSYKTYVGEVPLHRQRYKTYVGEVSLQWQLSLTCVAIRVTAGCYTQKTYAKCIIIVS